MLITDWRQLNSLCKVPYYWYEDIRDTLYFLGAGDKFVTADIKDRFFQVPVAIDHRYYLGFSYKGRYYRSKVLQFCLYCSSYYLIKFVRPVITKSGQKHHW